MLYQYIMKNSCYLLGKFSVDLKNYDLCKNFANQNTTKLGNINRTLTNYFDILQEVKKLCYQRPTNIPAISLSSNALPFIEEQQQQQETHTHKSKFIRQVSKNYSKKLNGIGLFLNNIIKKANEDEEETKKQELRFSSRTSEKDEKDLLVMTTGGTIQKTEEKINEVNNETKEKENGMTRPRMLSFMSSKQNTGDIKIADNDLVEQPSTGDFIRPPKTTKHFTTIFRNLHISNRDIITHARLSRNNEDLNELKRLKKEQQADKQLIASLTNEMTDLHIKLTTFDKMNAEFQESLKVTYNKEIENLRLLYGVLKEFYSQEIIYSSNIVTDLNTIIDDMVLNMKSLKHVKTPHVLPNFFLEKKNHLMENQNQRETSHLSQLVECFMNDPGTATKKLDFFLISMNKDSDYDINYGSGLGYKIQTKCPLLKNLNHNLNGDIGAELLSPTEYY